MIIMLASFTCKYRIRYQEELKERAEQEAAIQASLKDKHFQEEAMLKTQLIQSVQQLQQRKLALQQELSRRDWGKRVAESPRSPVAATACVKKRRSTWGPASSLFLIDHNIALLLLVITTCHQKKEPNHTVYIILIMWPSLFNMGSLSFR